MHMEIICKSTLSYILVVVLEQKHVMLISPLWQGLTGVCLIIKGITHVGVVL